MNIKRLIAGLLAGFAISGSAVAAIVDHGDYLTDTTSGFDWLDVTKTVNMSYNQVVAEISDSDDFLKGWRHATLPELAELIKNATSATVIWYSSAYTFIPSGNVDPLVMKFGSTLDSYHVAHFGSTYDAFLGYAEGQFFDFTYGLTATTNVNGDYATSIIYDDDNPRSLGDGVVMVFDFMSGSQSDQRVGSFLVRETIASVPNNVPEPTSIALISIAIAGLGVARRKKQQAV